MNWFLLLLLLKLLTVNRAAPIDLLETKDELQQDKEILVNIINQGFAAVNEANNLIETSENVINSTPNVINNTSSLNESRNENIHQQNFTLEVQAEVESNTENVTTKENSEYKQAKFDRGDGSAQTISPVIQEETKQEEISVTLQNPTETMENANKELISPFSSTDVDPSITENTTNDLKYSTEAENANVVITTTANEEILQKTIKDTINKTAEEPEKKPDISITSSISDADQVSQYYASILKETYVNLQNPMENSTKHMGNADKELISYVSSTDADPSITENNSNDLKYSTERENVEAIITTPENEDILQKTIEDTINKPDISITSIISSILKETTQNSSPETLISNTQSILESLYDVENIFNQSLKLTDKQTDKLTELTIIKEVETNSTSEQPAKNQNSETISHLEEPVAQIEKNNKNEEMSSTISTPIENLYELFQQNSELSLTANNNDTGKQAIMEETNLHPKESSNEMPALKPAIDSFLNQLTDIGSSFGKTAEELINDSSMKQSITEIPENMTKIEVSDIAKHEQNSEKAPTFKETVDTFIAEVVEVGSKLGLIPEEKPAKQVPITTEFWRGQVDVETTTDATLKADFKYQEDASTSSILNFMQSLDSDIEITTTLESTKIAAPAEVKTKEIVTTMPSLMDNSNEEEEPTTNTNTESSNLGRSVATSIGGASEIDSNIGKDISNLFSEAKIIPQSTRESPSSTAVIIQEVKTTSENREGSSSQATVGNSQENSEKTSSIDDEFNGGSSTTQISIEILQNSSAETPKYLDENLEVKQSGRSETEISTGQFLHGNLEVSEETKPIKEVLPTKYAEYIPVAVTSFQEGEAETKSSTEQHKIPPQMTELIHLNSATEQEVQVSQSEVAIIGNEKPELTETPIKKDHIASNVKNESKMTSAINENPIDIKESSKSADFTTISSIIQQETITPNIHLVIEETTNVLNKFENSLKALIEKEKLKQEERHALETTQQETTIIAPSTTIKEESTTTASDKETTILPKKFEEELQMAVKALEETTHHHFEEFQNNLKEAFKKATVWRAEHERQEETTLKATHSETTMETEITQQQLVEQPTTLKPEEDTSQESISVILKDFLKTEEPHRSGVINQHFVDKFADNYEETSDMATTETQMEKEGSKQMLRLLESATNVEQTTKAPIILTTMLHGVGQEHVADKENDTLVEANTMQNDYDVKEDLVPTSKNIVRESTEETVKTTTEITAETTSSTPLLARVQLQKDISSVSLTTDEEVITEAPSQQSTTQHLETEQLKDTNAELTQTTQPTEPAEEIITPPSLEATLNEMVTFIEHTDTTTNTQQKQQPKEDDESSASSQTQEPLTQAFFMEEQQQQIESTTEHDAQTQTTAASGQTATTAKDGDDTFEQQTTEAEIHLTTVVEKDEMTATTTKTAALVEPEARSLSLQPPKLEYLQNEDGVEVFYGYSIVKRN